MSKLEKEASCQNERKRDHVKIRERGIMSKLEKEGACQN